MNESPSQQQIQNSLQAQSVAAGLYWVRRELADNLQLASQLVEQHADNRQDPATLNKAIGHLHEVRGAAVLIQAYGLALLAEEMKQTVHDLAAGTVHEPDPAYSAVVGACVQATDYLDLLQNGQTDSALVLQPIVNELRLARGKSLLTEDDLFVAQFRVLGLHLDRAGAVRSEADPQAEAARLHPVFSSSLLAWFKDQDSLQALSRIGRVAELLADASRERALHQLWRTVAACVEALLSGALDDSLEIKRQFGRAGQLMKILGESGEAGAVKQMSDVSLRLLFFVGRSGGSGPRVLAIRQGLQLDTWLPSLEAVQGARARLRGANTGLLVRVAEELRADLAEVRDSIDVALRSGASPEEFEATAQRLKRVADTLLVLGLSTESQALAEPVETLHEAGNSDAAAWMEFATAVLQVDLSLENALYRQLQALPGEAASKAKPRSADLRDGTAALMRESLVNLARIKGYVESYIKSGDVFGLPEAARLVDEIAAGFRVLSLERAESLALEVQHFLQSPEFSVVRTDNTASGRFADTVASIEYYLEMRRDGSPGSEQLLDQLDGLVARLRETAQAAARAREPEVERVSAETIASEAKDPPRLAPEAPPAAPAFELSLVDYVAAPADVQAPAPPIASEEFHLAGVQAPEPTPPVDDAHAAPPAHSPVAMVPDVIEFVSEPSLETAPEPAAGAPAADLPPPVLATPAKDDEVDPEIREIFIDEAEEVLQTLQRTLPRWQRQPEDRESLSTIRRAFHTLKGSGRMVGAQDIGEFAWAIESMLNRCLDRTIEQTQPVIDTVRDAVALVPEMTAAFRDGRLPPAPSLVLADQARRLASGEAGGEDADLIAVFRGDANARLQMIMRWVKDQNRSVAEYAIAEPVVRAFHTLRGAALAIGAKAVGELSGSLETYLDPLHRARARLSDAGLTLIDECCAVMLQWTEQLGRPGSANIDARPWLERVDALRAGANRDAGRSDEDAQLAEIFAFEALDLVQKFEADLASWVQAPNASGHARSLQSTIHTLKGAASMAHCAPMATVAQELNLKLGAIPDGSVPPPAFFATMHKVVEGLYSQLDQFRDGTLIGDGAECVALVQSLDATAAVGAASVPAVPVPEAATPVVPIAPVLAGVSTAPDRELVELFLQEGEELVEQIERLSATIAARPDEPTTLGGWLRALHTLKGSARVAGVEGIGELAHRLETATETARTEGEAGRERFAARLRVAVDGLHELLDEARAGRSGGAERVLADFEAAGAVVKVERPALPELEPLEPMAVLEPMQLQPTLDFVPVSESDPEPAAKSEPTLEWVPEPVFEPAAVSDISVDEQGQTPAQQALEPAFDAGAIGAADTPDPELVEIFQPEAVELLESLGNTLHAWQEQPSKLDYPRQMQRDLHTFKGGARMAGLMGLGEAAHRLETSLVQIERAGGADAAALRAIAAELDSLQHRYERGSQGVGASPAPAEPVLQWPSDPLPEPVIAAPVTPESAIEPWVEPSVAEPVSTAEQPAVEVPVPETAFTPGAEPGPAEASVPVAVEPSSAAPRAPETAPAVADAPATTWNPELFWKPVEATEASEARREAVRVPVERLDGMLNQAGEISIYRSRLEENHAALVSSLAEMSQTITRVREQLRLMEVETEAQIAARGFSARDSDEHRYESEFDPLEMDRYSRMQELSRALAESVSDLSSLHASLDTSTTEAEGLLQQQGRINTEVQQGLMGTLMVPFSRQVQRLSRVVRQTAEQNGKLARAEFSGAESELDRNVLERMTAPLEHLLRNCVVHGIEDAAARQAAGKPAEGTVQVALKREGSQLLIEVRDDGRGLDFQAIRAQAVKRGLMRADAQVPDEDLARFVFAAGFSTARTLTQDAGRGIGMDVVAAEVKQLGGTVEIASETGKGVRFRIRLPLMLAVSQALVVQVGEELFAIPLGSVEGIARAPREALADMMKEDGSPLEYGGQSYQVRRLGELVGLPAPARIDSRTVPAILMRLGGGLGGNERRVAVVAERLIGNREIVTKPAGPVLGSVAGVSGATILADGRVMLIVDVPALIAEATRRRLGDEVASVTVPAPEAHRLIMVVDDSITIRRVTERLLTRNGYRVITAKDGLDAMATLQTEAPDAVLLDIEMPRADGFEVAAFIRNTPRIANLPIIMITSRSGDKHREHARGLGVNRYLIKPYQEDQLLAELQALLAAQEALPA